MGRISKKEKEYRDGLLADHKRMKDLRECGNANHLTDENGNFKSTFDTPDGYTCLGKLEETMQWIFYNDEFDDEDKLKRILVVEGLTQKLLDGIHYVPDWSERLKKKIG